jgi:hypothetical protein
MKTNVAASFLLLLSVAAFSGCGGGTRTLTTISVSPASAEGQAQFVATGTFSDSQQVTPLPVLWTIGPPFVLTPIPAGVSLSTTGMAQCTGFVGTVTVWATAPVDPNTSLSQMNMNTKTVSGKAQFTCP